MDTKTLYDWANEAGLNMKSEDSSDAIQVWIDRLMADQGWLADIWLDFLVEMMENKDGHGESEYSRFVTSLGSAHRYTESVLSSGRQGAEYVGTSVVGLSMHFAHMGEHIYRAMLKGATKLVEDNADEWWGDVAAYHYEMEAGQYEDYMYEQYRDRQLDERS